MAQSRRRPAQQAELRTLEDLQQVRALADPLRMKILGALMVERTTKQVADLLREKPTRLYHHVDALERAGLVQLTRTQQKRGTVEKYYRSVARRFEARVSTAEKSGEANEAMHDLMGATLTTTASELRALLGRGGGAGRLKKEGLLAFLEIHATSREIADARRRMQKVLETVRAKDGKKSPARRQRYRLTIAFFPLGESADAPPRRKRSKGSS